MALREGRGVICHQFWGLFGNFVGSLGPLLPIPTERERWVGGNPGNEVGCLAAAFLIETCKVSFIIYGLVGGGGGGGGGRVWEFGGGPLILTQNIEST